MLISHDSFCRHIRDCSHARTPVSAPAGQRATEEELDRIIESGQAEQVFRQVLTTEVGGRRPWCVCMYGAGLRLSQIIATASPQWRCGWRCLLQCFGPEWASHRHSGDAVSGRQRVTSPLHRHTALALLPTIANYRL
jgi:hypothetical protein